MQLQAVGKRNACLVAAAVAEETAVFSKEHLRIIKLSPFPQFDQAVSGTSSEDLVA